MTFGDAVVGLFIIRSDNVILRALVDSLALEKSDCLRCNR